jgi:hypothetical protein
MKQILKCAIALATVSNFAVADSAVTGGFGVTAGYGHLKIDKKTTKSDLFKDSKMTEAQLIAFIKANKDSTGDKTLETLLKEDLTAKKEFFETNLAAKDSLTRIFKDGTDVKIANFKSSAKTTITVAANLVKTAAAGGGNHVDNGAIAIFDLNGAGFTVTKAVDGSFSITDVTPGTLMVKNPAGAIVSWDKLTDPIKDDYGQILKELGTAINTNPAFATLKTQLTEAFDAVSKDGNTDPIYITGNDVTISRAANAHNGDVTATSTLGTPFDPNLVSDIADSSSRKTKANLITLGVQGHIEAGESTAMQGVGFGVNYKHGFNIKTKINGSSEDVKALTSDDFNIYASYNFGHLLDEDLSLRAKLGYTWSQAKQGDFKRTFSAPFIALEAAYQADEHKFTAGVKWATFGNTKINRLSDEMEAIGYKKSKGKNSVTLGASYAYALAENIEAKIGLSWTKKQAVRYTNVLGEVSSGSSNFDITAGLGFKF